MFRGSRGFGPIRNADFVVKINLTSWLASANATFETETTKCGGLPVEDENTFMRCLTNLSQYTVRDCFVIVPPQPNHKLDHMYDV
jgi:hypothetical protein